IQSRPIDNLTILTDFINRNVDTIVDLHGVFEPVSFVGSTHHTTVTTALNQVGDSSHPWLGHCGKCRQRFHRAIQSPAEPEPGSSGAVLGNTLTQETQNFTLRNQEVLTTGADQGHDVLERFPDVV